MSESERPAELGQGGEAPDAAEALIERLLSPCPPALFFAEFWERRTLHLQRDEAGGRFASTVEQCLEDGRISARDRQAIRDAGVGYVSAFMALMQRFEGMSDAGS